MTDFIPLPSNVKDLRARRFGRLLVQKFDGVRDREAYWCCDCDCGNSYVVRGKNLTRWEKEGRMISCGCLRADPNVRRIARLSMSPEDRSKAAKGERVKPARPDPKPRNPREKRILPVKQTTSVRPSHPAPAVLSPAPSQPILRSIVPAPAPAPATRLEREIVSLPVRNYAPLPAPTEPETGVWVVITHERDRRGYRVAIRHGRNSTVPSMQSRLLRNPSNARREAERIFGPLDWISGREAESQSFVVAIAHVKRPG